MFSCYRQSSLTVTFKLFLIVLLFLASPQLFSFFCFFFTTITFILFLFLPAATCVSFFHPLIFSFEKSLNALQSCLILFYFQTQICLKIVPKQRLNTSLDWSGSPIKLPLCICFNFAKILIRMRIKQKLGWRLLPHSSYSVLSVRSSLLKWPIIPFRTTDSGKHDGNFRARTSRD